MNLKKRAQLKLQITNLLQRYYEDYYRKKLGLRDWRERVASRLIEEKNLAAPSVDRVEDWMGLKFAGKRVLVVGAGTGAEWVMLNRRGASTFGIEPNKEALEILKLKAELYEIPKGRIRKAVAEKIPYSENSFDFVYCFTVIEHVQNVEKSVDEMLRVCKVGGIVYIQTPDYRFPYEGHYKTARPGFSSKWLTTLKFWLAGRPVSFLQTVNFVNAPDLDKIFMKRNVLITRVTPPWLHDWHGITSAASFTRFAERYGIGKDQYIFLRKLPQ